MKSLTCASLLLALVAALAACAGTPTYYGLLQDHGHIRVEPGDAPDHDYRVSIRNFTDIGYDGDVRADREKAISVMFERQCSATKIVSETMIESGSTIFGNPLRHHVSKVACTKKK